MLNLIDKKRSAFDMTWSWLVFYNNAYLTISSDKKMEQNITVLLFGSFVEYMLKNNKGKSQNTHYNIWKQVNPKSAKKRNPNISQISK